LQQQAALMAAATAQGTFINPMAALASQMPHGALNGMANPVVPPTSGESPRQNWNSNKSFGVMFGAKYITIAVICVFCLALCLSETLTQFPLFKTNAIKTENKELIFLENYYFDCKFCKK
jgi:hypothetical protein